MVIWKYEIEYTREEQIIPLPRSLCIVDAGMDGGNRYCIWVKVDPETILLPKKLRFVGTGEEWDETEWVYDRSFRDGPLVWHLLLEKNFYLGWQT